MFMFFGEDSSHLHFKDFFWLKMSRFVDDFVLLLFLLLGGLLDISFFFNDFLHERSANSGLEVRLSLFSATF